MTAIAMRMRTHKGLTAIQQGIALLRRLGDRASVFVPGVGQPVGPVNLILFSSEFTNSAWTKGAGIGSLVSGLADPFGGTAAARITPITGSGSYLAQNISLLNSTTYTRVAVVKPETDNIFAMEFVDNGAYTNTIFNTTTQAVTGTATSGASVTAMGGGWFICLRTWTTGATGTQAAAAWYTNNYGAATSTNTMIIHRLATMQGAVTPAQIISAGLPMTTGSASASAYLPWVNGASLTPTSGVQSIGPELVSNGDFANGTAGWTLWQPTAGVVQLESGGMRIRTTDATFAAIQLTLALSPGSTYQVTFTVRNWVNGSVQVSIDGTTAAFTSPAAAGTYTFPVVASGSCVVQIKRTGGANCDLIVDDVSCKLVTTSPLAEWLSAYVESSANTLAAVDGPVGFVSDGSGTIGPELAPQSLLAWSYYNTPINVTDTSASADAVADGLFFTGLVVGQQYQLSFAGSSTATITFQQYGGSTIYQTGFGTCVFTAQETRFLLRFGGVGTATFTKMSVRAITGRHATQGTGSNKPTLRGGLLNLLLNNEDPSQSGWGVLNASYALGQQDSAGGTSAFKIVDNVTSGQHHVYSTYASSVNLTPYTFAAVVKAGEHPAVLLDMSDLTLGDVYCAFNLTAGAVMGQGANPWTANAASIAPLGGGWYLCAISATRNSTGTSIRGFVRLNNGATDVFAGNGSSGIYCDGIGMFRGALTAQQIIALGGIPRTTTAAASGKVGNSRLEFVNGGTQSLALQSAPFSVSDDHVVIQGVTAQDTSGTHASFAMANGNSRFPVLYVSAGGYPAVSWRDDTGVGVTVTAGQVSNGDSFVFTGRKVGSLGYARKNGVPYQVAITGLGTTTATAAFIGASTAGTINWVGDIYPTVIVKGALSDAELLVLERFVGALTGPTGVKF